jgi:hypothetical protein
MPARALEFDWNNPAVIASAGHWLREAQKRKPRPTRIQRQERRALRLELSRERLVRAIRANLRRLELTPEELLARVKQGR